MYRNYQTKMHISFIQYSIIISQSINMLTIKLLRGEFEKDADVVGKMDPFVVLQFEGHKKQSKVMEGAGKTPIWNQWFQFPVPHPENAVGILTAYDKDPFSAELLGKQKIQLKQLCNSANPIRKNIPLVDDKQKPIGFLEIQYSYTK